MGAHEQFKNTLGEADKEFKSLVELLAEVKRISDEHGIPGGVENQYTTLNSQVTIKINIFSQVTQSIYTTPNSQVTSSLTQSHLTHG